MVTINVSEGKPYYSQRNNKIRPGSSDSIIYLLYKTINKINNKIYIGQHTTRNLEDGYLGSGTHLGKALLKYGKENFKREIISFHESLKELLSAEAKIVTLEFCQREDTYNLIPGGNSGMVVGSPAHQKLIETKNSPEGKLRASEAAKEVASRPETLKRNSDLMKKLWATPGFREKTNAGNIPESCSKAGLDFVRSEEGRKQASETMKKLWADPEFQEKHKAACSSPKARAKMSASAKKKFKDPKARISLGNTKSKYKYHTPFGIFNSTAELSNYLIKDDLAFCAGKITNLCSGVYSRMPKALVTNFNLPKGHTTARKHKEYGYYRSLK